MYDSTEIAAADAKHGAGAYFPKSRVTWHVMQNHAGVISLSNHLAGRARRTKVLTHEEFAQLGGRLQRGHMGEVA